MAQQHGSRDAAIVEIRAAEGGDDSKSLVYEQLKAYTKVAEKRGIAATLLDERPGIVTVLFEGKGTMATFANEPGGHRWQRVPPNERRGRVHTSTVTVAVLDLVPRDGFRLDERDVEITTTRGSGPGGQNRNKVESCVVAKHIPTGVTVRIGNERSQHQNKAIALETLAARISDEKRRQVADDRHNVRKGQVGSGMRGDKVRTYREQDDAVTDHRSGKRSSLKTWRRGDWA